MRYSSFPSMEELTSCSPDWVRDYRLLQQFSNSLTNNMWQELKIQWYKEWGVGLAAPLPNKDMLNNFYAYDYRKVMGKTQNYTDYVNSPNYRAKVLSQVTWTMRHVNNEQNSWLDIGSGFGLLLWQVSELLPNWKKIAVENDNEAIKQLARMKCEVIDREKFWLGEVGNKLDVISCSHVLEHLVNPIEAVKRIYDALNPGGILMLEVPNDDEQEMQRSRRQSDLPHLFFFSLEALRNLVVSVGFEICESDYIGVRRCMPPTSIRLKHAIQRRVKGRLALIEEGDWYIRGHKDAEGIRVVAKKPKL